MTEKPFIHKEAFIDFKTNFIFQEEVAKILFKIISLKGILNLGGKSQSVYNFVKKFIQTVHCEIRNVPTVSNLCPVFYKLIANLV